MGTICLASVPIKIFLHHWQRRACDQVVTSDMFTMHRNTAQLSVLFVLWSDLRPPCVRLTAFKSHTPLESTGVESWHPGESKHTNYCLAQSQVFVAGAMPSKCWHRSGDKHKLLLALSRVIVVSTHY